MTIPFAAASVIVAAPFIGCLHQAQLAPTTVRACLLKQQLLFHARERGEGDQSHLSRRMKTHQRADLVVE